MTLNEVMQLKGGSVVRSVNSGERYGKARNGLYNIKDGEFLPWNVLPYVGWEHLQGKLTVEPLELNGV